VEEGQRLKVIYGSSVGFHVIDVDSGNPYDIYIPSHVRAPEPYEHMKHTSTLINIAMGLDVNTLVCITAGVFILHSFIHSFIMCVAPNGHR
jgi:hypothetical protein